MRKSILFFLLSSSFTIMAVLGCVLPSIGFSYTRWGMFDAELSPEIPNQVVAFNSAHGGRAVKLGGGLPLSSFTFTAKGAPHDRYAQLVTLRMKHRKGCGGNHTYGGDKNATFVSITLDGTKLETFQVATPRWQNYSARLPTSMDVSRGTTHTWLISLDNPGKLGDCWRTVFIDIGGWETVGSVSASDFDATSNPWAVSTIPGSPTDDTNDQLHMTGPAKVEATPEISWGETLNILARGPFHCGGAAKVAVTLDGILIDTITILAPNGSNDYRRYLVKIPKGLRNAYIRRRVGLRFLNPGGNKNCQRFVDIDWIYGGAAPNEEAHNAPYSAPVTTKA